MSVSGFRILPVWSLDEGGDAVERRRYRNGQSASEITICSLWSLLKE